MIPRKLQPLNGADCDLNWRRNGYIVEVGGTVSGKAGTTVARLPIDARPKHIFTAGILTVTPDGDIKMLRTEGRCAQKLTFTVESDEDTVVPNRGEVFFDDGKLYLSRDKLEEVKDKVAPGTEMRLDSIARKQAHPQVIELVAGPGIYHVRVDEMDDIAELLGLETFR